MSEFSQGPGWWQASDGKWYAPQGAAPPAPPPPPPPPPPAAVVALIGGGVFWIRRDSGSSGEVFLEPVSYASPDSFTPSADAHNASATTTTGPVIPTTAPRIPVTTAPVRSVGGNRPGLYGGSNDRSTCDRDSMVDFLEANPDKARAWAQVFNIAPDQIRSYVMALTPVILQRDTRVTNHGFSRGRANPIPAVLQAGTAVMIDIYGVPRVKCGCGNPLTEPTPTSGKPSYTGTAWPTFSPANVIIYVPQVQVTVLVLVNVNGGDPFTRPTGTGDTADGTIMVDSICDLYPEDASCRANMPTTTVPRSNEPALGTGDVQVTLRWNSTADLDLAVTDPTGETVSYASPSSATGGSLDVDSNRGCAGSTTPVENIFWPTGSAPDGVYTIKVDYYRECAGGEGPQSFSLSVRMGGQNAVLTPAAFHPGSNQLTLTFDRSSTPPRASLVVASQEVNGSLPPGGAQVFKADKGPRAEPTPAPPDPATPAPADPGAPVDSCAQYDVGGAKENFMMFTLCMHDPTQDVVTGDAAPSVPN